MTDTSSNITIGVESGNTAELVTDYNNSGDTGFGSAHLSVNKIVWGESDTGHRTSLSYPLPVQIAGQSGSIPITGYISGTTGSDSIAIQNYVDGLSAAEAIMVAGNTSGTAPVKTTGFVQGITTGLGHTIIIATTGGDGIQIRGAMAHSQGGSGGTFGTASGILVQGTSAGATATVAGEVFPGYGFGIPIAVTGGRRLDSGLDSVTVAGQVNVTGGWNMTSATDSISVYGYDQGEHVWARVFDGDGTSIGSSGGSLNVNLTNAGMTFDVTIAAVVGVTNSGEPPLRIQGYTGASDTPITIRGEAAGAVDVISNAGLNTVVTNSSLPIDDAAIVQAISGATGEIQTKLLQILRGTDTINAIRRDLTSGGVNASIKSIAKPNILVAGTVSDWTSSDTQALPSNKLAGGITIKNSKDSAGDVLVGNDTLPSNPSSGYALEAGESIYLELSNTNKIYIRKTGGSGSYVVHYVGS